MLKEIFEKIGSLFERHPDVDHLDQELISAQKELEKSLKDLSNTYEPHADSIASMTHVIIHETLSDKPNKEVITSSTQSVKDLVQHFETSHPALTGAVERFLTQLSTLGI